MTTLSFSSWSRAWVRHAMVAMSPSELVGLCKRRRVEAKEGCCDVAREFFQDNVDEDDGDAFGISIEPQEPEPAEPAEPQKPGPGVKAAEAEAGASETEYESVEEETVPVEAEAEEETEEIPIEPSPHDTAAGDPGEPQPHTPDEPLEDHQPMHRSCTPSRSSLRASGKHGLRMRVSFTEMNVPESYLLDDSTGLQELIHVENCRFQDLWFPNPGAAVQCGWCQRDCPQAFGKLHGEEGRSQFAQTDFVCNECLAAAEEAWRTWQAQKEAEAQQPGPQKTSQVAEVPTGPTGPWDNPGSGWNDWTGEE